MAEWWNTKICKDWGIEFDQHVKTRRGLVALAKIIDRVQLEPKPRMQSLADMEGKKLPSHYVRRYEKMLGIDAKMAQEFWDKWAREPERARSKADRGMELAMKVIADGNKLRRRV